MPVKIRLRRTGTKKQPHYRLVVADTTSPRDGRFIEVIGHYHPMSDPPAIDVREDRALMWLQRGAQPTDTARALLERLGVWARFVAERTPARPKRRRVRPKRAAERAARAASAGAAAAAAPSTEEAGPTPE